MNLQTKRSGSTKAGPRYPDGPFSSPGRHNGGDVGLAGCYVGRREHSPDGDEASVQPDLLTSLPQSCVDDGVISLLRASPRQGDLAGVVTQGQRASRQDDVIVGLADEGEYC